MKKIEIRLRSVRDDNQNKLSMSDTNGKKGIAFKNRDDIGTDVAAGDTVHWILETNSGIAKIVAISGKTPDDVAIMGTDKAAALSSADFSITIPDSKNLPKKASLPADRTESVNGVFAAYKAYYTITYITDSGDKVVIDPYIRVKPT